MAKITLSLLAAALAVVCWSSGVVAQELLAPPVAPSVTEYMTPVAPAAVCCPIQVVSEVSAPSAKRSYRCHGGPIQQLLCVDNPADCCRKDYSVPVCVPACCVGDPVCCGSRVGLLGRGYVTYRWPCGFEATIVFRAHGGVIITYR
ncbi:hypothetical protein Pla175_25720 [Pirellulimonas nuda]|uniref:Uncharacterized protein n=1 Tax=Pirellulimonas nuda TaxID=2528009 RepID=A0A518DCI7_9BACT|nr:hypothetical protein [Pirellulimonas nuda]QDU89185.1 hypothetical protein Pla175_25720 [Pirellulimonas nuda]